MRADGGSKRTSVRAKGDPRDCGLSPVSPTSANVTWSVSVTVAGGVSLTGLFL